jgi:hypothetical protein
VTGTQLDASAHLPAPLIETPPPPGEVAAAAATAHMPETVPAEDSGFTNFLTWAKLEDPADVSEILLNDPAIGTVSDSHGNTFLHGACDVGNISMVNFFLKHFPLDSATSLQSPNDQGFEPIHMAAFGGMLHVIG